MVQIVKRLKQERIPDKGNREICHLDEEHIEVRKGT